MSKGDTFENDFLKAILWGTAIANIVDNAAASPLTLLWFALHTADPGEAGTMATSEVTYGGYARVSTPRSAAGFTIVGSLATLTVEVPFAQGTSGSGSATFFSIGVASSGAAKILWSGPLTPTIPLGVGATPVLAVGTNVLED